MINTNEESGSGGDDDVEHSVFVSNETQTDEVLVESNDRKERCRRIAVGLGLCCVIAWVIIDSGGEKKLEAVAFRFLEWLQLHPYEGVLAVVCVYVVATVFFVPGSILTLGTGYAFGKAMESTAYGVFLASVAVFLGASLGSMASFLLGRYLLRGFVLDMATRYPMFRAIDLALQRNGLKIMILLRLSPLIPYNVLDYMSGVTSISFGHYTLAMLGMIPGVVMFCSAGAGASSLVESSNHDNEALRIAIWVTGIFFACCGLYAVSYYAKHELKNLLAEEQSTGENDDRISMPLQNTKSWAESGQEDESEVVDHHHVSIPFQDSLEAAELT